MGIASRTALAPSASSPRLTSAMAHDARVRVETILQKYAQYGDEEKKKKKEKPSDAFEELYQQMEDNKDFLAQKSEDVKDEQDRAVAAQLNAEIRRGKAALRNDYA